MTTGKKISIIFILFIMAAGAFFLVRYLRKTDAVGAGESASQTLDRTYTVQSGDLVIGLMQSGSVNAQRKHKMSLDANFNTQLTWVIEENARVKEGDILAKFETSNLMERIDDFTIQYDNLEHDLAVAIEQEKIQISSNAADIRTAEDRVTVARDNLRKYRQFQQRKQRDDIDQAIRNAEAAHEAAVESHRVFRRAVVQAGAGDRETQEKNEQQLEALANKVNATENTLNNTVMNRKLFRRYDHPAKLTELMNQYEQVKLNLEKVKISTASSLVQRKKAIDNITTRMRRIKNELDRHKSYVDMMQLVSPVDGVVIYGDPDRRWGSIDIRLGMDVRKGQVLMTIPDMANLVVEFDLPEQYRSKVSIGDRAIITPDSLPQLKFNGKVAQIATLPISQIHWDRNSPKIYQSVIRFEQQHQQLVSGMTVQIEVVTRIIRDTLFVPVEAVFEHNERFFVYRQTPAGPRDTTVQIGDSNDNYVQILDGLNEEDTVYLYRPYQ